MAVRHVESTANPLVKELVGLRQRRTRESSGNYIVEGAREARRALSAGVGARLVVVAPGLLREGEGSDAWQGAAEAAGAELVTFSTQAFERVSLREHPDGVLLVARSRRLAPEDVALPPGALVLVLVGLEKPGNVGALLRSADAVGVDAVFMCPDPGPGPGDREADFEEVREAHREPTRGVDLESPNVIRAAMGSSFALPIGVGTPAEVVARLRAADLRLVAAARRPHALAVRPEGRRGPRRGPRARRPERLVATPGRCPRGHPDAGLGGRQPERLGGRGGAALRGSTATVRLSRSPATRARWP